MSTRTYACYEREGWQFSLGDRGQSSFHRLEQAGLRLPHRYSLFECCIKHLDSGIKFRFHACDAIAKREDEKISHDPLHSTFPSYGSPLRQVVDHEFDCAYVGDVFIEGPGGERQSCRFSWEDIDRKTLHEQIDWMTANEKISGLPNSGIFHIRKDSEIRERDGQVWLKEGKVAKKYASETEKVKRYEKRGLMYQLVNHMECIYEDDYAPDVMNSSCYFNMVVTVYGWFFSLRQLFENWYGDERRREMTMHCNFKQNVVYREIIDRQTEDFEQKFFKFDRPYVCKKLKEIWGDDMRVHFHEAKQLKIQEAYRGGSSPCTVRDPSKYSSFTVGEWKETSLGAFNVPDDKIKLLFDNCGEKIQSIEARTGTRIEIIPLFRHPYNPKVSMWDIGHGKEPRAAYVHGSENDVEYAKSCLAEYLAETSPLCSTERERETDIAPPSSDGVKSRALLDVAAIRRANAGLVELGWSC